MLQRICAISVLAVSPVFLSACSEMMLGTHLFKKATNTPAAYSAPAITGKRKTGNPYEIMGKMYYPLKSSDGYRMTGIASWYGKDFHGKKTANGERYNMYAMTAAHTTLPLPTYVRVTNLDNGKSIVVRLNDRGPFLRGRLIDLSYRAAVELDMAEKGTSPVLVEALPTDGSALQPPTLRSHRGGMTARVAGKSPDVPYSLTRVVTPVVQEGDVSSVALDGPAVQEDEFKSVKDEEEFEIGQVGIFVQTGAFSQKDNAVKQKEHVSEYFNSAAITELTINAQLLYRVRVGPFKTVDEADDALSQLLLGPFQVARIVVE